MTHWQGCSSYAQQRRCARCAWLPAALLLSAAMLGPAHTPAALPCHADAPAQLCASVPPRIGSLPCEASHAVHTLDDTSGDTDTLMDTLRMYLH